MTTKTTPAERRRAALRAAGYEFEAFPLLCAAAGRRTFKEGMGYECVVVPETFGGPERCTVYFLGYRPRVPRPTRLERGCFIGSLN